MKYAGLNRNGGGAYEDVKQGKNPPKQNFNIRHFLSYNILLIFEFLNQLQEYVKYLILTVLMVDFRFLV